MKWIVIAILVVVLPYTFLRWHYRKPGKAFEPYHDMKDRANTMRLLSAGFQRVTLEATRPAEAHLAAAASATSAAGGLPEPLASSLLDAPLLPGDIMTVSAAPAVSALLAYPIEFTCGVPDHHQQLSGAELYVHESSLYIVPRFERLNGGLLARSRQTLVRVTVPAGVLKPGHYTVMLIGGASSRRWPLEVK